MTLSGSSGEEAVEAGPVGPVGLRHSKSWSAARRSWYSLLEHTSPSAFCAWHARFPDRQVVGPDTDLVIEGYPASANSWLRVVFQLYRPDIRIASHMHSAAHVEQAVALGVPTVVLLRPPVDCVTSLMARYPDRRLHAGRELRSYYRFYSGVLRLSDHLILIRFDDAVDDVESVVRRVGPRLATTLDPPSDLGPDLQQRAFTALDHWSEVVAGARYETITPRPSRARAEAAAAARARVEAEDPALLAGCQELYERLASLAASPEPDPTPDPIPGPARARGSRGPAGGGRVRRSGLARIPRSAWPLALIGGISAADAALTGITLAPLLVGGPLVAGLLLPPVRAALMGVLAAMIVLPLAVADHIAGTASEAWTIAAVVAASALAVWISRRHTFSP